MTMEPEDTKLDPKVTGAALDVALQAHFAALIPGVLVTGWTMTLRGTDGDYYANYSISSPGQDHMITWALAKLGNKIHSRFMDAVLMDGTEDDE